MDTTSTVDTMDDMIVLRNRSFHGLWLRCERLDEPANPPQETLSSINTPHGISSNNETSANTCINDLRIKSTFKLVHFGTPTASLPMDSTIDEPRRDLKRFIGKKL